MVCLINYTIVITPTLMRLFLQMLFGIEATADMIIEAAEKAGILKSDN
jgi:hypothetical protein